MSDRHSQWDNAGELVGRLSWRFFAALLGVELGFVILNIVRTPSHTLDLLVELNAESVLPVWFSSTQLFLLAATCFLAWKLDSGPLLKRAGWLCAAAVFLYLSVDETAAIHERWGASLADQRGLRFLGEPFWVFIYGPPAVAVAVFMFHLFWSKLRTNRRAFVLALIAVVIWLGTFPLEMAAKWLLSRGDSTLFPIYRTSVLVEEFSEMAGATLLWAAVVQWIRGRKLVMS